MLSRGARRKLQVVISESGQPNGRPYHACTTNGRQVNARRTRSDAAAASALRAKLAKYRERMKPLIYRGQLLSLSM